MRITGGAARGISLEAPAHDRTRPATDKLRLALFSSLGDLVVGKRFLDLYAGTGSYGLEAWSRGAESGMFVESDRMTLRLLQRNVAAVAKSAGLDAKAVEAMCADALATALCGRVNAASFDLVFADPPYAGLAAAWHPLFTQVSQLLSARETSRFILEMPSHMQPALPSGWEITRRIDAGGGMPTACVIRRVFQVEELRVV